MTIRTGLFAIPCFRIFAGICLYYKTFFSFVVEKNIKKCGNFKRQLHLLLHLYLLLQLSLSTAGS